MNPTFKETVKKNTKRNFEDLKFDIHYYREQFAELVNLKKKVKDSYLKYWINENEKEELLRLINEEIKKHKKKNKRVETLKNESYKFLPASGQIARGQSRYGSVQNHLSRGEEFKDGNENVAYIREEIGTHMGQRDRYYACIYNGPDRIPASNEPHFFSEQEAVDYLKSKGFEYLGN